MMKFTDAVQVSRVKQTADGYLVAEARAVREGVQMYTGAEVGLVDKAVVSVYRPRGEVFSKDSLQSFSHAPVTLDHPAEMVTAENWKDLAVGEVSTAALPDGEWVMLPLILKDAKAIAAVRSGKCELSAGYQCDLDFTPGVTADGHAYDAQQRNIRINHLAIVDRARAGSEARIGDAAASWGAAPITTSEPKEVKMTDALKTVVLGDKAAQVAAADAQVIEQFKADTAKRLADAEAAHTAALAAKDAELAKKDAEIDDLRGKVLTDAALDAKVRSRADLIAKAKTIAPTVATDGKSEAEIRKAVVIAKKGEAMADKSPAYLEAAFDLLADSDTVRDAFTASQPALPIGDAKAQADAAYSKRTAAIGRAWEAPAA